MRISMETGIRAGALRKMKWKHISKNTAISKEERKQSHWPLELLKFADNLEENTTPKIFKSLKKNAKK